MRTTRGSRSGSEPMTRKHPAEGRVLASCGRLGSLKDPTLEDSGRRRARMPSTRLHPLTGRGRDRPVGCSGWLGSRAGTVVVRSSNGCSKRPPLCATEYRGQNPWEQLVCPDGVLRRRSPTPRVPFSWSVAEVVSRYSRGIGVIRQGRTTKALLGLRRGRKTRQPFQRQTTTGFL